MRTRNLAFLLCCLAASNALAANGFVPEGAEIVSTPAISPTNTQLCPCPTGAPPCETPATPPSAPWYYWWSSWHWFDNCHDRGQHYPYLPPLPGWYYFRPYSVGQLRAQQEAVMQWGGDPRNPYAGGIVQSPSQPQPPLQPQPAPQSQRSPQRELPAPPSPPANARTTNAVRQTSLEVTSNSVAPIPPASAGTATIASEPAPLIPWPTILRDARFSDQRARVETPFRRDLGSQPNLSAADCQNIAEAGEQMKNILWQMGSSVSTQDSMEAERFLSQLIAEARGHAMPAAGQVVVEQ